MYRLKFAVYIGFLKVQKYNFDLTLAGQAQTCMFSLGSLHSMLSWIHVHVYL